MGVAEKAWAAFRDVLRLQDKVTAMVGQVKEQQLRVEHLTVEVAQLKMAVAMLLAERGIKELPKLPLDNLK